MLFLAIIDDIIQLYSNQVKILGDPQRYTTFNDIVEHKQVDEQESLQVQ